MERLARDLTTTLRTLLVAEDEEHNAHLLRIEDRTTGFLQRHSIGVGFIESAEYRTLLSHYADIAVLHGPMVVTRTEAGAAGGGSASKDAVVPDGGGDPGDTEEGADASTARSDREISAGSFDELIEYFIAAGKRGVAINRYKGLGEMNPDQLWATTMKPEDRTLLQVRAEDDAEADRMFTTLMGDQVEPRRKFIEDNALDVKNLDV